MEDDLRAFRDALLSFSRYGYQEMIGWILSKAVTDISLFAWDGWDEHEQKLYALTRTLFAHLDDPNEHIRGVS